MLDQASTGPWGEIRAALSASTGVFTARPNAELHIGGDVVSGTSPSSRTTWHDGLHCGGNHTLAEMTYSPTSVTSMTYSPTSEAPEVEVISVASSEVVSIASASSSSSSVSSTSPIQDTDNYTPTSPSDGSALVADPEATFWADTSTAVVAADAAFELHGLYFVRMHRAFHLLSLLLAMRTAAGASEEELSDIRTMMNDAYCEARATWTLFRAAAFTSGRRL
jgi:hypothetical protein